MRGAILSTFIVMLAVVLLPLGPWSAVADSKGPLTTSAWTQLSPTGGPPSQRAAHSAVYDSATNRMVLFGGGVGSPLSDVWVLGNATGLGGTPTWSQLSPTGGPPAGRRYHSAVYAPLSNRMVVFGGNTVGPVNEVWILTNANGLGGTPAWIQASPTGGPPAARGYHAAVYDSGSNRMVIFGGSAGESETWVLENATGLGGTPRWTQLNPTSPPSRVSPTAVFDESVNRMVVFGGCAGTTCSGSNEQNDVWVLENATGLGGTPTWKNPSPSGSPPPARCCHTNVFDEPSGRMVLFGGCAVGASITCDAVDLKNDLWVLKNATGSVGVMAWESMGSTGTPPSPRYVHTAVYDTTTNRMTVFGGSDSTMFLNDVWVLSEANGIPINEFLSGLSLLVPLAALVALASLWHRSPSRGPHMGRSRRPG